MTTKKDTLSGDYATSSDGLSGYRNVLAIVTALTLLQTAMAALAVVVALTLRGQGVSNIVLGAVSSAFAGGFLIGARFSPIEIARIGHIRSFALFAASATIGALALHFAGHWFVWLIIHCALGLCCAALFASGESWIADAAPQHLRGSIIGFYHLISKAGAIAGPFIVSGLIGSVESFMLLGILFASSLIPVTSTRRSQPVLTTATPYGPKKIFDVAPTAAVAAFCAGAVNNSVAQLYPVFTATIAPEDGVGFTAQFNAFMLAGAMISLWPAGLISDRMDRRVVIGVLGCVGATSAFLLWIFAGADQKSLTLTLAALYGAGSLSYYAIAVAHAADRSQPEETTSIMAGILVIWGIGSVVGPIAAGAVMNTQSNGKGLFLFAGVILTLMVTLLFTRIIRMKKPVPTEDKEAFAASPATSLAIAEFDPRGGDEQFDLFSNSEEASE